MGCCCSARGDDDDGLNELAPAPLLAFDKDAAGPRVTLHNHTLLSGHGTALADSPILQDKGYFEITLKSEGPFAVGVAANHVPLDTPLNDKSPASWIFASAAVGAAPVAVGDTIGCAVDQADYPVQVYFYKGSQLLEQKSGVRGEVLPAFSVSDGAVLEVNFGASRFAHLPPGFDRIIKSKSLL